MACLAASMPVQGWCWPYLDQAGGEGRPYQPVPDYWHCITILHLSQGPAACDPIACSAVCCCRDHMLCHPACMSISGAPQAPLLSYHLSLILTSHLSLKTEPLEQTGPCQDIMPLATLPCVSGIPAIYLCSTATITRLMSASA